MTLYSHGLTDWSRFASIELPRFHSVFAFEPRWINCEAERRDTTRPVEADCTTPISMTLGLDLFMAEIRLQLLISGRTDFRVNEGRDSRLAFSSQAFARYRSSSCNARDEEIIAVFTQSCRRLQVGVVGLQAAYTLETRFYCYESPCIIHFDLDLGVAKYSESSLDSYLDSDGAHKWLELSLKLEARSRLVSPERAHTLEEMTQVRFRRAPDGTK
ncbi:hypothetical protein R3P38DRAFT_3217518 [Favolaschia claudopus]|uniref:Uncharacterized protein n=1 Tax=Favolaschia claudopus TaxID=2862362 RepID=A0AAW0A586_9AGAR